VKILDMGLARVTSAGEQHESWSTLTVAGTFMGTPDFMAPEQWENPHTTDIRADVYSLGCTLYYCLAGRVPFPGGTLIQKLDKHRPGWRDDVGLVHAHDLALIAADLDTANVAEPFARFAASAENLCLEREMLCLRDLETLESAQPVLGFLTDGQDRFFFDLHRFNSDLGRLAFGAAKDDNATRLKSLSLGLRARIAMRGRPESGRQVLKAYSETVAGLV
jgi:serine/threonine protein kinase